VKPDAFTTLDELHRAVLAELASAGERWVGHKLLLPPAELRSTLAQTDLHCLLLLRDPRDAALSFFHRTGGGVELYARTWRDTARLCRELAGHPRLLVLRFEDLLVEPKTTLQRLGRWLGVEIDSEIGQLHFQRSRAHGSTEWRENSAFQDVAGRFDRKPLGRWKAQAASPIVRYAAWVTRRELVPWGYEPAAFSSQREQLRFSCLHALERSEHWAHDSLHEASQWLRKRLEGRAP
jgi:Sulfotransferase domain